MLGENIKKFRQENNYTQEEFAKKINVTRQTISKWEKNISVPDIESLLLISECFNIDINVLLEIDADDQHDKDFIKTKDHQLSYVNEQKSIKLKKIIKILVIMFLIGIFILIFCFMFLSSSEI